MLNVHQRKKLYGILTTLFSYPDEELEAFLESEEPAVAARLLEAPPPPRLPAAGRRENLETDYTGLFINRLGGAPAPPYGSVYLEEERAMLMGQTTVQVAEAYQAQGLSLTGSSDPPDFLPTELEFLYYLVEQEEQALQRGKISAAREAARRQADFCRELLHPWIPGFCKRIEQEPQTSTFYRWTADLLLRFCRCEQAWLERQG